MLSSFEEQLLESASIIKKKEKELSFSYTIKIQSSEELKRYEKKIFELEEIIKLKEKEI
jgi:uncharacterized protein YydD (DUF2326 family)